MPWANHPIAQQKKRDYQREWKKARERKHRDMFVRNRGGGCERCGCSVDLEFHHRMPQFKKTHRIWYMSVKRIEAELAHCELLCRKPCHVKAQLELRRPRQWCGI